MVNISDIDIIRDTNNHLRDQAGVQLVPSWVGKNMDRRTGSSKRRRSPSRGPDRSLDRRQGDDREEWRPTKKRRSPSQQERKQDFELSGLSGLSPADISAAVSALLAKPVLVPSRAPCDGFYRLGFPLDAWRKVARGDEPFPIGLC